MSICVVREVSMLEANNCSLGRGCNKTTRIGQAKQKAIPGGKGAVAGKAISGYATGQRRQHWHWSYMAHI